MSGNNRIDKINSELKREIAEIVSRKLKNPLISAMVSVTEAETSKDLSYCKVYVSVFSTDKEKCKTTFAALTGDAGRIRHELSKSMRIRTVPELHFVLDDTMEYGDKMDKLLKKIEKGEPSV